MNAELTGLLNDHRPLVRRLRFVHEARLGERVLRRFTRPQPLLAVCDTSGPNPFAERSRSNADSELLLALFPADQASRRARREEARTWLAAPSDGCDGTVDVVSRDDRILWRTGRAAFLGSPEQADGVLDPLIVFAFIEGQIRRLESEVDTTWTTAHGDIPLTHQVGPRDLAQWARINEITRRVTQCRLDCCDLQRQLEYPSTELSASGRQVLADLCGKAGLAGRIAAMDARLGVMMNLYQVANDRLSAYSYFRREWWLEIWIILVILAEMAVIFLQVWLAGGK